MEAPASARWAGRAANSTWDSSCASAGRGKPCIGQSTHHGTVTAADDRDEPARTGRVRPGLPGSAEELFHEVGEAAYWLDLRGENPTNGLRAERLQRFTGVIYRPETERWSHDVHTRLSDMYDALLRRNERGGAAGRNGRHGKSAGEPG